MIQRYQINTVQQTGFITFGENVNPIFNIGDFDNMVINSIKTNNYIQIHSLTRMN